MGNLDERFQDDNDEQMSQGEEEQTENADSEATISEGDEVYAESDSEDSDTELVVDDWSNRTGPQKKLNLNQSELEFVQIYLKGKFSEEQGNMVIDYVRKQYPSFNCRKPKALVNHLVDVSFEHYHYVECDCGNLLKKEQNRFFFVLNVKTSQMYIH